MKKILALAVFLAASLCLQAQIKFTPNPAMPLPDNIKLYYNSSLADYTGRFPHMQPVWFIWADGPCTAGEAETLVDRMGLNSTLKDYVGMMVVVFSPVNGKDYSKKEDFEAYKTLFEKIRVFTNLKVVGIGKGATFVNECIAPVASEVADILSIDGKPAKKIEGTATVPAYIAGKQAKKVAKAYIARNKEKAKEEPLLQVIVNTEKASLGEIVADAWERLLSRNYRCSNLGHTGYMGGLLGQYGDYELEPYPVWERLGLEQIMVEKSLFKYNGKEEKYLWYEYVPASMKDAPNHSIPLVILLHGHNNDPRTQAETSGFPELGAQEGFMVAELEWQGKSGLYDYMGDHGIEAVVLELLKKYPQLDPSRIYAEGLSAGGFTATAIGITKSHLFAAVGAHSGGLFNDEFFLGFPFMNPASLKAQAVQKAGKVQMPYFSITGTADEVVPYGPLIWGAWNLYQVLNGIPVEGPGTQKGLRSIETSKNHAMEVGDFLNASGQPVIRTVAVENFGHWNFVPGAREMWEFFKLWARDPKTGESIYKGL